MVLPREKRAAVQRGSEGDRARHSGGALACRHEDLVSQGQKKKERNERSKEEEERKRGGKGKEKGREWERNKKRWFGWCYVGNQMQVCNIGSEGEPVPRIHPGLPTR